MCWSVVNHATSTRVVLSTRTRLNTRTPRTLYRDFYDARVVRLRRRRHPTFHNTTNDRLPDSLSAGIKLSSVLMSAPKDEGNPYYLCGTASVCQSARLLKNL